MPDRNWVQVRLSKKRKKKNPAHWFPTSSGLTDSANWCIKKWFIYWSMARFIFVKAENNSNGLTFWVSEIKWTIKIGIILLGLNFFTFPQEWVWLCPNVPSPYDDSKNMCISSAGISLHMPEHYIWFFIIVSLIQLLGLLYKFLMSF